ncbi:MAG: hypothetical protein AAF654_04195 [Myxococcota bacterium]
MTIRVVQFSKTRLAGAPIRIANAVNSHTSIRVRHVDSERWGIFDHDHVHIEEPEQTLNLAENADVIHLYNYLDLDSDAFAPVDFRDLERKGKRFVRHFESTPMRIAKHMGVSAETVVDDPLPQIVIAQYPERFFPRARVVPNIVPESSPLYAESSDPIAWDVLHGPSNGQTAWQTRWESKGQRETLEMLKSIERESGYTFRSVSAVTHHELMAMKRRAGILIDELVTGSYHLSTLEGLCLGRPVLAFLDPRTEHVLREISGTSTAPVVNVRLEDAGPVIKWLVSHPEERQEIGRASRQWIEDHWSESTMAKHIEGVYVDLLENPERITRQRELSIDVGMSSFFHIHLPDAIFRARSEKDRLLSQTESKLDAIEQSRWHRLGALLDRLGKKRAVEKLVSRFPSLGKLKKVVHSFPPRAD